MPNESAFDSLNSVRYLYLREIGEPRDNALRVVVQEAIVNSTPKIIPDFPELPELAALKSDAFPIESTGDCKSFELFWNRYAAYLVTEELAGSGGNHDVEVHRGSLFRLYTKSNFLEHLSRDAGGIIEPIQHYKLICLNHLVDVASYTEPDIGVIDPMSHPVRVR